MKLGETALAYIASVCGKIKDRRAREALREELTSHLEEIIDQLVSEGYETDRAEFEAVSRMGDPRTISGNMNKVYSPMLYTIAKYSCLVVTCVLFLLNIAPFLFSGSNFPPALISDVGAIGGADGPTAIYVATTFPLAALFYLFLFATLFLFLFPLLKNTIHKSHKK